MKRQLPSVNKAAFLAAYRALLVVAKAAAVAGISRQKHYTWLREDPDYAAAFEKVHTEAVEHLEATCYESATIGLPEPVVYQGQVMYEPKRNKDGSLKRSKLTDEVLYTDKPVLVRKQNPVERMFLLKAHKPDMYREHTTVEHTGAIDIVARLDAGRARVARLDE